MGFQNPRRKFQQRKGYQAIVQQPDLQKVAPLCLELAKRCGDDWSHSYSRTEQFTTGIVRTALVDTAACILAGRDEEATHVVLGWARAQRGGASTSAVFFGAERLSSTMAALVNGVAGHCLDYDDVGLAGHPSAVIVPVLLAECERFGARGVEVVQAYAKAYAVWGELERRVPVSLHARGWHPSATYGVVAAAAAAASLRALDERTTAHALGIAASFAGGIVANFGSMTKPLHIGRAAQAGIEAVELAAAGLDSSPDALDGRAGLLAALTGGPPLVDLSSPIPDAFERTLLERRPGIKKYPVCYAIHRVADGVLLLLDRHGFLPADVSLVEASISETAADVLRHQNPGRVAEARFSLEFSVAAAIVRGHLGVAELSEEVLNDVQVRDLMRRVKITRVDTQCPLEPSFAYTDRVTIVLRDGGVLESGPIRYALGHPELPVGEEEVEEKLRACVKRGEESLVQKVLGDIDALLMAG